MRGAPEERVLSSDSDVDFNFRGRDLPNHSGGSEEHTILRCMRMEKPGYASPVLYGHDYNHL
jgi:hypothetical protein